MCRMVCLFEEVLSLETLLGGQLWLRRQHVLPLITFCWEWLKGTWRLLDRQPPLWGPVQGPAGRWRLVPVLSGRWFPLRAGSHGRADPNPPSGLTPFLSILCHIPPCFYRPSFCLPAFQPPHTAFHFLLAGTDQWFPHWFSSLKMLWKRTENLKRSLESRPKWRCSDSREEHRGPTVRLTQSPRVPGNLLWASGLENQVTSLSLRT